MPRLDERITTGWLVIALMAVSATKLRIAGVPVGIGELLLFGWVLFAARDTRIAMAHLDNPQSVLTWFWIVLGCFMSLGAVWAWSLGIASPGAGRDAAALSFAAAFSIIAGGVIGRGVAPISAARWTVAAIAGYLGSLAMIHAFLPSLVTDPGAFGNRMTALTTNPNQLALYLVPFPAIVTFLLARAVTRRARVLLLGALGLGLLAGGAVASDALACAWLAGGLAGLAWLALGHDDQANAAGRKWIAIAVAAVLVASAGTLLGRFAPALGLGVFPGPGGFPSQEYWERNQVNIRLALWRSGLEALSLSPLVGLGPGRHSGIEHALQGEEAHNSFIDLATMAGFSGPLLLLWVFLMVGRPRRFMNGAQYAACTILLTLAIYASLHLVIRHPIFWFYILLAGALTKLER